VHCKVPPFSHEIEGRAGGTEEGTCTAEAHVNARLGNGLGAGVGRGLGLSHCGVLGVDVLIGGSSEQSYGYVGRRWRRVSSW
jgi:hypothetical protein